METPRVRRPFVVDVTVSFGRRPYALDRIILARALNAVPPPKSPLATPDHPRACGERHFSAAHFSALHGSSPRVRGTPWLLAAA
jgi:hypothetical protein